MFKFINFIICLVILVVVCVATFWYVTTPQPAKAQDQLTYGMDTAVFNIARFKQGGDESVGTWRDLAREGNSAAQLYQAQFLFAEAKNRPEAYTEAMSVLDKLAKKGIPDGQNAYGVMIRDGLGGLQADKVEAYKWFSLASQRGSKLGEENMLQLAHIMSSSEIYEAESRASNWLLEYLENETK